MNKNFLISFLLILFTTNCGFKPIQQNKLSNFHIAEINTIGDKRINYKIRNLLFFKSEDNNKNLIQITLNTNKEKNVKERNIKNEITKYQILIKSEIIFNIVGELKKYKINTSRTGDYIVADNYSTTLSNEKKLISDLVEGVSENILDEINLIINDL